MHELTAVLRQMRSDAAHVALVVATLSIGIVAVTIVFSVVNAILLSPLPYSDADRLALMRIDIAGIEQHPGLLQAEATRLANLESLEAVEVFGRPFTVPITSEPMRALSGATATPGLFEMLGVQPVKGRPFTREEAVAGGFNRIIISHSAWQLHFGGDPAVVGSSIQAFGRATEIIGVLPPGFRLEAVRGNSGLRDIDVWYPLNVNPDDYNCWCFGVLVRHAPGRLAQAREEVAALAATMQSERPDAYGDNVPKMYIEPLQADLLRDVSPRILALFATVGVVLLLACTSAAGLITARMRARRREFAVRSALGASRGSLLRHVLLHSVAVGILVCAIAVPASSSGLALFMSLEPGNLPRAHAVTIDLRVLSFGIALAIAASLLSACVPAWQTSRIDPAASLKQAGPGAGRIRRGVRGTLVVAQLAFCFTLLVSAALLLRTFANLTSVDPGFRYDDIVTAEVTLDGQVFPDRAARWRAFRQLVDGVRQLPGVEAAGAVSHIPLGARGLMASYSTTGLPETQGWSDEAADFRWVVPGYFETLRIPVLSGRTISVEDNEQLRRVVVIGSALAERAFPGQDPVGRTMYIGIDGVDPAIADPNRNDWTAVEIIGVVQSPRIGDLRQPGRPQLYLPHRFRADVPMVLTARVSGDTEQVLGGIRATMATLNFGRPLDKVRMLSSYVDDQRAAPRFLVTLLGSLAGVAVLLSVFGVYGIVAYLAGERRGEIGIRKALGAQSAGLVLINVREGFVMATLGIGLGLLAAPLLGNAFRTVLFGVPPLDPASYALSALLLMTAALTASLLPALRASRTAPSEALRRA